jgi:hypothetical protein
MEHQERKCDHGGDSNEKSYVQLIMLR